MTPALQRVPQWAWLGLVAAVIVVSYCASMTATGPWDPWETHYGEVARQILIRHDPLDLWWRAGNGGPDAKIEGVFWSKPALPYWLMAVSMDVFRVGWSADPSEMVRSPWPEIAIRIPSMLAGFTTAVFLGYVVRKLVSARAGLLTALVLLTLPQFAIVTRQALTDLFFVGPVVLATGAWAMAWLGPDRALKTRGAGWKQVPWDRAYLAFAVLLVLAVVVPVAVLHQHSFDTYTWKRVGRFAQRAQGLRDIQIHMFIYWVLLVAVVAASLRWRRRSQVWMGILYLAGGLSLMGKGLIGPGLIGVMVVIHLVVSGRWGLLLKCGLPTGVALFALAGFPWHHAMVLYRGERWVNELIIMNNLARFASGEQTQAVGGFAYYLETLGLAGLPWSALFPFAMWGGVRAYQRKGNAPADEAQRFALLWFVASLGILSYSITKYYHYLLPCLPAFAMLVGIWLDRALSTVRARGPGVWLGSLVGIATLVAVVRDTINEPAWIAHLTTYLYTAFWKQGAPGVDRLIWTCAPFAVGLLLWPIVRRAALVRLAVFCFGVSGLATTTYVLGDYLPAASESWSQRSAFRHYFANRGENDIMVSWWFYYRGETFFTKGDLWVMRDVDRKALQELFVEREGKGGAIWFITTVGHAKRLKNQVPTQYRGSIERAYESFHYALLRIEVP